MLLPLGNVASFPHFLKGAAQGLATGAGSKTTKTLPKYWFSTHLHCKFPAVYQNIGIVSWDKTFPSVSSWLSFAAPFRTKGGSTGSCNAISIGPRGLWDCCKTLRHGDCVLNRTCGNLHLLHRHLLLLLHLLLLPHFSGTQRLSNQCFFLPERQIS